MRLCVLLIPNSSGSTADDDQPPQPSPVQKKLKKLEEEVGHLEKCLAAKEQEETMLLKEMEVRLRSERGRYGWVIVMLIVAGLFMLLLYSR